MADTDKRERTFILSQIFEQKGLDRTSKYISQVPYFSYGTLSPYKFPTSNMSTFFILGKLVTILVIALTTSDNFTNDLLIFKFWQ